MKNKLAMILILCPFFLAGCSALTTATQEITQSETALAVTAVDTPSPTETEGNPAAGNSDMQSLLVVFGDKSKGRFYLTDVGTGKTQQYSNPKQIIDFVDAGTNDCDLLGFTDSDYLTIDINSGESEGVYHFDLLDPKTQNPWLFPPLLSPDEKKVAYIYGSGEFYEGMELSEYEFQDLVVKDLADNSREYSISNHGGARFTLSERIASRLAVWSPDSQWIAYSDLDDMGTYQVYVSRYDGSQRRQMTERSSLKEGPFDFNYSVSWSPSGTNLAISYYDKGQKVLIFDFESEKSVNIIDDSFALWWVNDSKLILDSEVLHGIGLFNQATNEVTKIINDPERRFYLGAPFGNRNMIGYFLYNSTSPLDSEFHVYDISNSSEVTIPEVRLPSEKTLFWFAIKSKLREGE